MKGFIVLMFVILPSFVVAQQDTTTIFRRPRGYVNDPIRADWDRKVEKNGNRWVLNLYDRKKVLQESISFEDEKLEIRMGPYAYYKSGQLQEEGNFDKGYKHGEWKFYKEDKQLYQRINYVWDKVEGLSEMYWNNTQLARTGKYLSGRRVGFWNSYYHDGRLAGKEMYDETGTLKEKTYYDPNGTVVDKDQLFQLPSYPGGLDSFYESLSSLLKYPTKTVRDGVQGIVKLSFIVKKDGSIEDIKVLESPHDLLSMEAIRVLRISGKWIPGKELGAYVNERYSLPIKFSLGNK